MNKLEIVKNLPRATMPQEITAMRSSLDELTSTISTLIPLVQQTAQQSMYQPPEIEMIAQLNNKISLQRSAADVERTRAIQSALAPAIQTLSILTTTVESIEARLKAIESALPRRATGEIRKLPSEKYLNEVLNRHWVVDTSNLRGTLINPKP